MKHVDAKIGTLNSNFETSTTRPKICLQVVDCRPQFCNTIFQHLSVSMKMSSCFEGFRTVLVLLKAVEVTLLMFYGTKKTRHLYLHLYKYILYLVTWWFCRQVIYGLWYEYSWECDGKPISSSSIPSLHAMNVYCILWITRDEHIWQMRYAFQTWII